MEKVILAEKKENIHFSKEMTTPRKKRDFKFIRINTSTENYDTDYEIGRIQTFISEFKNRNWKN